eukprot:scaffold92366_cov35-Tisochrysis_lutea.AAC.1
MSERWLNYVEREEREEERREGGRERKRMEEREREEKGRAGEREQASEEGRDSGVYYSTRLNPVPADLAISKDSNLCGSARSPR